MRPGLCIRRSMRWLVVAGLLVGGWGALQWPVRTRQGVNYVVSTHTVPLYLKLARFIYRDLEYRHLARQLTAGLDDDEAKIVRLYEWVRAQIHRGTPDEMDVIDDHVWHIIVRGYGEEDQVADVLATLCAYAGIPAAVVLITPPARRPVHALTMVQFANRWHPIDPFYGVIVRDPDGRWLSRAEIMENPTVVQRAAPAVVVAGFDYHQLYQWLPDPNKEQARRPYHQMPLQRAWDEWQRRVQVR